MATKNGLVTLVVPEGDIQSVLQSLDDRVRNLRTKENSTSNEMSVELAHLRKQLYEQTKAQGCKSM